MVWWYESFTVTYVLISYLWWILIYFALTVISEYRIAKLPGEENYNTSTLPKDVTVFQVSRLLSTQSFCWWMEGFVVTSYVRNTLQREVVPSVDRRASHLVQTMKVKHGSSFLSKNDDEKGSGLNYLTKPIITVKVKTYDWTYRTFFLYSGWF